ncbi:amidase [Bacillus sp. Y1]|nr:SpoIID/LytB domain-containing protein [Bacillus sp. Y1]AYA78040.1 amidase [Bacillus sp. Y1]
MKGRKLPLKLLLSLSLAASVIGGTASGAEASTISVKLVNYTGNRASIDFNTEGTYKLANNNTRISGKDRFEVANNVASSGWNNAGTVLVVNYLAFADALSASPLAYKFDAPILLTKPNELPQETEAKIRSLNPSRIVIVGGTGSISSGVENKLRTITATVDRIGGKDRFEVAKHISDQLGQTNQAIVTNGLVFADALSIAPYAAKNQIPILLTRNNSLPDATKQALQNKNSTLVIGGEGSVNNNVYSQLNGPSRIGGRDRYEVSANIINQLNLNASTVYLSTGLSFADALTGSVLAAKQGAPLLLTKPNELPSIVSSTIQQKQTSIVNVLGGPASVSEAVVGSLPNEYHIQAGVTHTVKSENGRLLLLKSGQLVKDFGTTTFTLTSAYSGSNKITLYGSAPRTYLGNMDFALEGAYVRPYNKNIPFEDYLKGVVPREMPSSWGLQGGMEALKAQAIAARTYSIRDMGKTVVDSQAYQVYGGYDWADTTSAAVEATKNQVMKYNGQLISAVYSSSNGGRTATNTDEWGTTKLGYLSNQDDPYDTSFTWNVKINKKQIDMNGKDLVNYGYWWWNTSELDSDLVTKLKTWLSNNGHANKDIRIAEIKDFVVAPERNGAGRAINAFLQFDFYVYGETENGQIKKQTASMSQSVKEFRSMFGTINFKSTLLHSVDHIVDTDSKEKIVINGSGFGHGVGLSQHGAYNRSKAGQNYGDILRFYYPGAQLTNY